MATRLAAGSKSCCTSSEVTDLNYKVSLSVLAVIIAVILGAAARMEFLHEVLRVSDSWIEEPIELPEYFLYDLGVADIDQDQRIDIYTTNHFARSAFLINSGSYRFSNQIEGLGLTQDPRFPGLEMTNKIDLSKGDYDLSVYWEDDALVISYQPGSDGEVTGEVSASTDVRVENNKNGAFSVEKTTSVHTEVHSVIEVRLRAGGIIRIYPDLVAVRFRFRFDHPQGELKVGVGREPVVSAPSKFDTLLGDRHGAAWRAGGGDWLHLFIARGGLKGRLGQQPGQSELLDEYYFPEGGKYRNRAADVGPSKAGCSAHQAAWADVDSDNELELYVVCRRAGQPNQVLKLSDGRYSDVAPEIGLASTSDWPGPFVWLDIDDDQDVDLISAEEASVWLYVNNNGVFRRQQLIDSISRIRNFSIGDFNGDSIQDVYVTSESTSRVLVGTGDGFTATEPATLGMPASSITAHWLDFDNDGDLDLFSVPQGLYEQGADGTFSRMDDLAAATPNAVEDARVAWFDADNDGRRDVLLALKFKPSLINTALAKIRAEYPQTWQYRFFRNNSTSGHWLQVTLSGSPGNESAYGSSVVIKPHGGKMQGVVLGSAESSHASQGHNRVYFGLGDSSVLDEVTVKWPDGSESLMSAPPVDRLLHISKEGQLSE